MTFRAASWILRSMEYEYDGLEEYGGRVLWGRIAFFASALLLMFVVGRCTSAAGVPQSEVDQLKDQIAMLSEQKVKLEDQLAAAEVQANNPLGGASEDDSQAASDDDKAGDKTKGAEGRAKAAGSKTYTVQSGDTLNSIAKEFYGDERKFPLIAEANDLGRGGVLVVGQELVIPPDPDSTQE
jgi:nucleoid-associated protein YgaU